jgi:hypothetical protein
VDVSVNVPPPALPVYDQPPIPDDGYLWTPGYWAWSDDDRDYYWVPGTWVLAPQPDYLWTPGYWEMAGAVFLWHAGYWGPHVGFYGGINYGYGYGGHGYEGGYWRDGRLFYNRSVNNIDNTRVTTVYSHSVVNNVTVNRVSYNGGNGVHAQPTAGEMAAEHDRHIDVTPAQRQHMQAARSDPSQRLSRNHGHPPMVATPRPGAQPSGTFSVVHAPAPSPRPSQPQQSQGASREPNAQRNVPEPRPTAAPRIEASPRVEAAPRIEAAREPRAAEPPPRDATPHPNPPHPTGHPPENHESHEPH